MRKCIPEWRRGRVWNSRWRRPCLSRRCWRSLGAWAPSWVSKNWLVRQRGYAPSLWSTASQRPREDCAVNRGRYQLTPYSTTCSPHSQVRGYPRWQRFYRRSQHRPLSPTCGKSSNPTRSPASSAILHSIPHPHLPQRSLDRLAA